MATISNPQPELPSVCRRSDGFFEVQFQAMGTHCSLLYDSENQVLAKEIGLRVLKWVRYFELRYSRFIKESFVSKVNSLAGLEPCLWRRKTGVVRSLSKSELHYKRTLRSNHFAHFFALGFQKKDPEIPSDDKIKRAIDLVGWKKVVLNQDEVFLPLPGMGLISEVWKRVCRRPGNRNSQSCGVENGMVNFGGDIHAWMPEKALTGSWDRRTARARSSCFCFGAQRNGGSHFGTYARFFAKDGKRLVI